MSAIAAVEVLEHGLESHTQLLVLIERLLLTNLEALGLLCVEIVVVVGHACCVRMCG